MSHKLTMKNVMNRIISNIFLKQTITGKKIDHVDKNVRKRSRTKFGVLDKLWPTSDRFKARILLRLTRPKLRKLVAAISEHCNCSIHASKRGIQHYDYGGVCQNINMKKSIFHILCQCPAFKESRLKF